MQSAHGLEKKERGTETRKIKESGVGEEDV
jgi:hypothetical protein